MAYNSYPRLLKPCILMLALLLFSASSTFAEADNLPPGDRPPLTVIDRVNEAGTADDFEGSDHIIAYEYAMNRMKETGVTYVDQHVIYKVLTKNGCKNQSVLTWAYDPRSSYVEVSEVNIIRDNESIPVDVSKVKDLPAPQRAIYWSDRIKTLQLPRLQINDGIEIITFRKGYNYALLRNEDNGDDRYIPPMAGEYFDIVRFEANVPMVEKKYVLSIPKEKRLQAEVYNGTLYSNTTYSTDSTYYAWWNFDIPAFPVEPRQPGRDDIATKVVMVTAESWEAKSRWFYDVNDVNNKQFEVTPEIQAKVDEIFEEAGVTKASEERKAEVLVHWVAQNIRYSGQTMGEGEGFTLHSGAMIFEQRSGVCKDIAGMLITMMRAAGMDSYAAMTMAGSRIEEIPADQFNHCVTALKKDDGTFEMYDPTWVPYNHNIWSKLETEQHYLIGTPEGEHLMQIPYSPPEESHLKVAHDAKILEDGTLEGKFLFEGTGALDSRLRRIATRTSQADMKASLAGILSPISDRVENVEYKHLIVDDFSRGMWIEVTYNVPEFALPVDGGFEFKSPMMNVTTDHMYLFRAGQTRWNEDRQKDVFLYYTQWVDGTETIRLPKGFKAVELPESEKYDETYASFEGTSKMTKKGLVISQDAKVKRRQIPPDGYEGFYNTIQEVHNWKDQVYRITKGGAK